MTRRRKPRDDVGSTRPRHCHVNFDEAFAASLDAYMIGLGLENRAAALISLAYAGMSALPLEAMVGEVLAQQVTEMKLTEMEALAEHYAGRAEMYRTVVAQGKRQ